MPEFEVLTTPIRIGVVSDTHLVNPARGFPPHVLDHLRECDIIFHAGDLCSGWVLDVLATITRVDAVHGNNDSWDLQSRIPRERYYQVGGYRLAMLHGHVSDGQKRMTARTVALDRMRGVVDCVIYGHSHQPEIETRDGLLMVNPGSPTQPRWAPSATLAIVQIDGAIDARLMHV